MTTRDARWAELVSKVSRQRDEMARTADRHALTILAGGHMELMGKPVEFTLSWPAGLPAGFTDETALKEWAADCLRSLTEKDAAA